MSDLFLPKIMVLATEKCAYPGADAVGKAHQEYPSNVYARWQGHSGHRRDPRSGGQRAGTASGCR